MGDTLATKGFSALSIRHSGALPAAIFKPSDMRLVPQE
jgi:hypothetical protein